VTRPNEQTNQDMAESAEVLPALSTDRTVRGEIDVQIATARRYPRSIKMFRQTAMEMATLDEETAEACFYALPRDGKTVEGPSARLAEILASAWGHMRVEGKPVSEDDRFVVARGVAWDVQVNVAIAFESRRRITNKRGQRYSDDMIAVTANAATSIALRNAILKVVPSAYWRPIYLECRKVAVGDASTLVDRRAKMLEYFQKMGVSADRVFALLNVPGVEDIGLDQLAQLKGLATAIKEGDTTVDEAFPQSPSKNPTPPPAGAAGKIDALADRIAPKAPAQVDSATAVAPIPTPTPAPTPAPAAPAAAPTAENWMLTDEDKKLDREIAEQDAKGAHKGRA